MSTQGPPDRDRDRLLREVALGERAIDDADVQAVAAENAAFREDLASLQSVTERLETAAKLETDVLRRADELRGVGGERAVRHALERATQRSDRRIGRFILMAAALVIAVSGILVIESELRSRRGSSTDIIPDGPYMDVTGELRAVSPIGTVETFETFRWHDPDGPRIGDKYVVEVYPEGERVTPLATSEPLDDSVWQPSQEERETWPTQIDWVVTRSRIDVAPVRSASVSASRSR